MSEIRYTPTGGTSEQVLAEEVGRLRRDLADLRSTLLARTSPSDELYLYDSGGARWRVTVSTTGVLTTTAA